MISSIYTNKRTKQSETLVQKATSSKDYTGDSRQTTYSRNLEKRFSVKQALEVDELLTERRLQIKTNLTKTVQNYTRKWQNPILLPQKRITV